MSQPTDLRELRGLIATVNLTGTVTSETMHSLMEMRAYNMQNGLVNLEYREVPATLVEAGRDICCAHAVQQDYDFLLMFDGDAAFGADAFARLLRTAYLDVPDADVVGAYAQLKQPPYLPTIDTGTGKWEPIHPNGGIMQVIRTGGHFLLVKTPILRRCGPPWFRTRRMQRPIDAFAEVDNYARVRYDGMNPFAASDEWTEMLAKARAESGAEPSSIGEDSGFCDRVKAAGGNIVVNTDIITGHVAKRTIMPKDLKDELQKIDARIRLAVGVM